MTGRGPRDNPDRLTAPLRVLLYVLVVVNLIAAAGYVFFTATNGPGRFDASTLAFAAFPITGAVIILRQPRNLFGWLVVVIGFLNVTSNFLAEYAFYALVTRPGSLPGGDLIAWFSSTWWLATQPLAVVIVLIFPNGRPPSRRWWWLVGVEFLISLPIFVFLCILFWNYRGPGLLGSDLERVVGPVVWQKFLVAEQVWGPTFAGGLVLAVIGQTIRFVHSRGIERQQFKWILLAMTFIPIAIIANLLVTPKDGPLVVAAASALNVISILGLPITMTVAITRYHLYDIDVIIRRTLLYGALTVSLALIYFASVVLLQAIVSRLGGGQSPVIIVLSTLMIAGLFSPLRARFQRGIDRRFYRSQYNSELILEHFSSGLKAEVDLDAINHHLLGAVEESLQPEACALWLVKQ